MKPLATLLITLLLNSCSSPFTTQDEAPIVPPTPTTPQLQFSSDELTFDHNASRQTIQVQANSSWEISPSNDTWYKAQRNEDNIEISVEAHTESKARSEEIVVVSGALKRVVTINQTPPASLVIAPRTADLTNDAAKLEVNVHTNIEYSVIVPANALWIRECATRTEKIDKLSFEIDQNATGTERSTQIIFKDNNSTLADTLTITQNNTLPAQTHITLTQPGLLAEQIMQMQPQNITHLAISGPLNSNDFQTLQVSTPRLQTLDLNGAQCTVVTSLANKSSLQKVVLPQSVITIDDYTFKNCTQFNEMNVPPNLQTIGRGAFQECKSLPHINIHNRINTIGEYAFAGCENLTEIELPASLKTIEPYTFRNCLSISRISIPSETVSIGASAFSGCAQLETIDLQNTPKLASIGEAAFKECTSLKAIELPANITLVGAKLFYGCKKLKTVVIPQNTQLKSISNSMFYGCSSLQSIQLPQAIEKIEARAFYNCSSLLQINLPMNLKTVEALAFKGCTALKTIICSTATPPDFELSDLTPDKAITIKVPTQSESLYRNHEYWGQFTISN